MEQEILFSKYYVRNVLKKSEKTRVLLADWEGGSRIIKEIVKDNEGYESLQWESAVLKALDCPGVPRLYEVLETDTHAYLVEEYLEGITLQEMVCTRGALRLAETIYYGRKLADIVRYLHSNKPNAVLHLDIQPKNILIHNECLYLIDFGNAAFATRFDEKQFLKGTRGYAAPEQYSGEQMDVRTDLYGIGACMAYMMTGDTGQTGEVRIPECMRNLIRGCTAREPEERFENVDKLIEQIRYLELSMLPGMAKRRYCRENQKSGNQQSGNQQSGNPKSVNRRRENESSDMEHPTVISFAGTQPRIGTSVLAMGFVQYLQAKGIDVAYEEHNRSEMVSRIVRDDKQVDYVDGDFYYHGIPMRPYYSSGNVSVMRKRKLIVRDEGTYTSDGHYGSWLVMVAGIQSWEKVYTQAVIDDLRDRSFADGMQVVWIWNFTGGRGEEKYIADLGVAGIRIPYMNQENSQVFETAYEKIWKRLDCEKSE